MVDIHGRFGDWNCGYPREVWWLKWWISTGGLVIEMVDIHGMFGDWSGGFPNAAKSWWQLDPLAVIQLHFFQDYLSEFSCRSTPWWPPGWTPRGRRAGNGCSRSSRSDSPEIIDMRPIKETGDERKQNFMIHSVQGLFLKKKHASLWHGRASLRTQRIKNIFKDPVPDP